MSVLRRLPAAVKRAIAKCFWPLMPSWPDEGRRIVQGPVLKGLIERAARQCHFRRVLNAGSGESGFAFLLATLPGLEQLLETDIDLSGGRARVTANQIFFRSSLTDIPLPDRSIDLVLCTEVLEHIPDDGTALDEIARVLVPTGWLLISVPTPPAVPDPAHVREGYKPEDLRGMLEERGFNVLEIQFCMYRFFRWILANWEKLPYRPRVLIRGLSYLDWLLSLGPPMDLVVLARRKLKGE